MRKKTEFWQENLGTSVFNPIEVLDLQAAIADRKDVAIVQGRKFTLKYLDNNKVFYQAVDAYCPAGYLDLTKFMRGV